MLDDDSLMVAGDCTIVFSERAQPKVAVFVNLPFGNSPVGFRAELDGTHGYGEPVGKMNAAMHGVCLGRTVATSPGNGA
jgi:hypothetical protein